MTELLPTGVEEEKQQTTGAASYVGFAGHPKGIDFYSEYDENPSVALDWE